MKFKEAYEKLEEIYNKLNSEKLLDIEEIVKLQKEAEKLYKLCNEILSKNTDKENIEK